MNTHGKDIKIFSGNSNPELAKAICRELDLPLGNAECITFSDGESYVSTYETVRGSEVFLVQSTCGEGVKGEAGYRSVNDQLMELLIMIDAMRRASAACITAVIPYFGYARQDRKAKARDPISAKLVANLLTTAGADRVLTMDIHCNQIKGFFDIPMDNLVGNTLFVKYFTEKYADRIADTMIVSPDVGANCNFGCGSITCNYDGNFKYRTTVGDNAFIGCNTNLVSPCQIGDGAYTAAGTTLTGAVPADALAIGRPALSCREDWAAKHRALKEK